MFNSPPRRLGALVAVSVSTLALAACSAGSLGSSSDKGGKVTLTFLVDNADTTVKTADQLAKDFSAKNPNVTIKVDSRPGGSEPPRAIRLDRTAPRTGGPPRDRTA